MINIFQNDNYVEEFKIISKESKIAWEKLLGHELKLDTVRVTRSFYLKHSNEISAIQMINAIKFNNKSE